MSNNLNRPTLTQNQNAKEVTVNDSDGILDAAITETLSVIVASGNVALTQQQWTRNVRFRITDATVAGRTVTLFQSKRFAIITADSANTENVQLVRGATTYDLAPGVAVLVITDGTADGMDVYEVNSGGSGPVPVPYDVGTSISGKPEDNELVVRYVFVRTVTLPSGLAGSHASAGVGSTGNVSFSLSKNGAAVGSIDFNASATGTFTFASDQTFAPGDVLTIRAPTPQDATLADVSITLAGTR